MKKIGLFLFAATAAIGFSSCNDTDGDYPAYAEFVTVRALDGSSDYFLELDSEKTIFPGDKSRVGGYTPIDKQRAIVFFNLLDPIQGYDYNAALYTLHNIYTGASRIITTQLEKDELVDNKISLLDWQLSKNYLTLRVAYPMRNNKDHKFEIIRDEVPTSEPKEGEQGGKFLSVALYHDAGGDTQGTDYDCYISFDLRTLHSRFEGMDGIKLRVNTQQNDIKEVEMKFPTKK